MNIRPTTTLPIFGLLALFSASLRAATNDLLITSITHLDGCTTLTWRSHPNEHYRVYWTDAMSDHPFWRVAAFCVSSGGTNTTWSEGCENMMMAQGANATQTVPLLLSEEERAKRREEVRARALAGLEYLESKLKEAQEACALQREQQKSELDDGGNQLNSPDGPPPLEEGEPPGTNGTMTVTAKFFRVARLPHGFADGWGAGLGALPTGSSNWVAMSAGGRDGSNGPPFVHSLALRCDGTVAAWGANCCDQTNVPTNLVSVVKVAAGGRHSIALRENGTIAVWGDNSLGQVTNVPPNLTNIVDVKAGLWHSLVLKADGTVAVWGDLFNQSNAVPSGLSNVIAIAAGPRHCLALLSNRTVRAWGFSYAFLSNFLPTNTPAYITNVIAISAGMEHNQAMRADGTVIVWGNTNNSGMALPSAITNATAIAAGWHFGHALLDDGSVEDWGATEMDIGRGMNDVVGLAAGALHTLVIRTNEDGLRITRQPRSINLPLGTNAVLSVTATNRLNLSTAYQWQKNGVDLPAQTNAVLNFPALSDEDDGIYQVWVASGMSTMWSRHVWVTNIHAPVITNQTPELDLRRPQGTTFSLRPLFRSKGSTRVTFVWHKNGAEMPLNFLEELTVQFASTNHEGAYHVIVRNPVGAATSQVWQVSVTLQGEATGWGDNTYGQSSADRSETNLIAVAGGGYHSLALRENGSVIGWGDNTFGQRTAPAGLTNAIAISAGNWHSLALRDNGMVTAWGLNDDSQTNCPAMATNVTAIAAGGFHNLALKRDGTVCGWGENTFGQILCPTSSVAAIAAGRFHSLALQSNGTVLAWGRPLEGQTTVPSLLTNDVVALAAGALHSLALRADGTVVQWGDVSPATPGPVPGLSNVMQITAGDAFSAALKNDFTVVTWTGSTGSLTGVSGPVADYKQISAGNHHLLGLGYSPLLNYPIKPSEDLLVICNTNSADSLALRDYYLAHRPMIGDALTLNLGCETTELFADFTQLTNQLIAPVLQWLETNPTKCPNFILFMRDIPSSYPHPYVPDSPYHSTQWHLREALPRRKPFVSALNMATLADATNYVNKLAAFGSNYSPGKVVISPRHGGYSNVMFPYDVNCDQFAVDQLRTFMLQYTGNSNQIMCRPALGSPIVAATNVAAFHSQGFYSGLGSTWATNGVVRLYGDSAWFFMDSGESFNGMWSPLYGQGSFQLLV